MTQNGIILKTRRKEKQNKFDLNSGKKQQLERDIFCFVFLSCKKEFEHVCRLKERSLDFNGFSQKATVRTNYRENENISLPYHTREFPWNFMGGADDVQTHNQTFFAWLNEINCQMLGALTKCVFSMFANYHIPNDLKRALVHKRRRKHHPIALETFVRFARHANSSGTINYFYSLISRQ